jgi:Amt family ammonium transporter
MIKGTKPHRFTAWLLAGVLACLMLSVAPPARAQDTPPPAPAAEAAPPAAAAPAEAAPAADAPKYESLEKFAESPGYATFMANNIWMMLCAALVFIMHLGFATVESGLTRSKNTVNILFKNTLIPCIGLLTYALCGFNLMYPGFEADVSKDWFGFAGWGVKVTDDIASLTDAYNPGYTYWTDFLFQAMFAATAATIVSGAVAERIKLGSFLIFSTLFVAVSYPITGSWKWGYGWLNTLGFYDFAGSTLVHSVGGWGALAGVIVLGPRLGKYKDGKVHPMLGHSLPLATIGVFLLWLGWFGFNGGSVLSANPGAVSLTLMTTCLAAAAGGMAAAFTSWIVLKKPDLSMALNGILAGLVGITAGADQMAAMSSVLIGAIAGIIVVFSVLFFDKIKIDDPVGAISVHLVCGIWGTLAVGLFGAKAGGEQLWHQVVGIGSIGAFTFIFALVLFLIIKATLGLRVSAEEETEGLDIGEHGNEAYPDFQPAHHA